MAADEADGETYKPSCRVIIIVGGGLAGQATAIGIKKAGLQVLMLEQATELREVIMTYLSLNSETVNMSDQLRWSP